MSALPVTDTAGVLIGIVTIDDVLHVAEAAATKEIQQFGGSEALDEPYMQITFLRMIKKRAGWLTALFLGEMLTATAMGFFEKEIEKAVAARALHPAHHLERRQLRIAGVNAGHSRAGARRGDAARLVARRAPRDFRRPRRSARSSRCIGFARITIWSAFSPIYGPHWLLMAITVAVALVGVVLWGTLVGSLLPFVLRRLGFDPATSSAPLVATLVDVTGLIIYFSVAELILLRMM